MLTHIRELINDAIKNNYAIGAFNVENLETTLGVVRAAVKQKSPVILQVSERTIEYAGLKAITTIVECIARDEAGKIPIALHLDHGRSFRSVAECIDAGFSSIMIDASEMPMQENIILTKQAADYAHRKEVWAQGELGAVKALEEAMTMSQRKPFMTRPEEAKEFVEKTGVDTLAVAVGNIHGVIKLRQGANQELDIDRLSEIHQLIPETPLVLHGASGLGPAQLSAAIKNGIRIVNMNTELKLEFIGALRKNLHQDPDAYDPRQVFSPAIEALAELVGKKLRALGSNQKA
ncbi:ketose-bisphosphate aldolase [Candidatus Parcubacteria bacterium]|jgi:fructose-bisphosphate aldolase class II|nr:MAG: ketose-bisphosphate aldolase [Candidatus Parcubacteria bacterium]